MGERGSSLAEATPEVTPEWASLLRALPGYDPFRNAGGAWFDDVRARDAIAFIEECVTHVEGAKKGEPFLLERWQKSFVANLFGWLVEDEAGRAVRRYREALLYVPRKNGKTPLAAAVALCAFFTDGEAGQQDYIAAADREQAGMLFRQAKGMVEQCEEMAACCRVYGGNASAGQSRSIVREGDGSFLRVISSDANTKHGGNSHLTIIDELHAQPDRELVDVLSTSTASLNRKQPLTIYITTADFDRPSICNEKHEYARRVRDGLEDDPRFLPAVYEADREDDWKSEEVWAKANPNLGVSVSVDYLRRECKKAQSVPAYESTFRRLHLNQKTEQDTRTIDLDLWDACAGPVDADALAGAECFGGLDLSTTSDLTAFVLVFALHPGFAVLPFFWCPKATAESRREKSRRDRVDYDLWGRQGLVKFTAGNVIDYDVVRADIVALAGRFRLKAVAVDRWNATQITTQLMGDGIKMVPHGQGYADMSPPLKELITLLKAGRLAHGGNPVLRWNAANLAADEDPAGNLKPNKAKSADRIDGLAALLMALGLAMKEPAPGSIYDTQQLEVI